jgi:hypothetical protein
MRYLFLEVWPARQARNAAAACSRSSALLNLRRGCFGGGTATDVAPLMSSTPCRRIRLRCFIRDQFVRPDITHFLATRALHSKAAGRMIENRRLCLSAPNDAFARQHRRGRRTGEQRESIALCPPKLRKKRGTPGPTRQSYTRAFAVSAEVRRLVVFAAITPAAWRYWPRSAAPSP